MIPYGTRSIWRRENYYAGWICAAHCDAGGKWNIGEPAIADEVARKGMFGSMEEKELVEGIQDDKVKCNYIRVAIMLDSTLEGDWIDTPWFKGEDEFVWFLTQMHRIIQANISQPSTPPDMTDPALAVLLRLKMQANSGTEVKQPLAEFVTKYEGFDDAFHTPQVHQEIYRHYSDLREHYAEPMGSWNFTFPPTSPIPLKQVKEEELEEVVCKEEVVCGAEGEVATANTGVKQERGQVGN